MANPEWIELFDRNSNERLAASKLASRKKKQASKQVNKRACPEVVKASSEASKSKHKRKL